MFGARWVTPRMVVELLACWKGHFGKRHNIEIQKALLPSCLMRSIWTERDAHSFAGSDLSAVKLLFFRPLYDLTTAISSLSPTDFMESFDLIF